MPSSHVGSAGGVQSVSHPVLVLVLVLVLGSLVSPVLGNASSVVEAAPVLVASPPLDEPP